MPENLTQVREALPVGATVGPYRVLERLGRGGMGTVHRAVHIQSGRSVALKTVHLQREGLLSGLRREIRALALEHPGIVRILDEGVHEGSPWYAMEFLEATTLRRWAVPAESKTDMASSGWWTQSLATAGWQGVGVSGEGRQRQEPGNGAGTEAPPSDFQARASAEGGRLREVLSVIRTLCAPLAYLHGEGIVHRDLKPENVLLAGIPAPQNGAHPTPGSRLPAPNLRPVIVDFGLASTFGGSLGREALEFDGGLSGTVSYMAPEQIRGDLLDARADLYAMGCVVYELVAGRPPFVGRAPLEVLDQHLVTEPTPPSEVSDWLVRCPEAQQVDELVLRLLAKEPRARFGHADDVAAALARLGAESGSDPGAPRARAYLYRPGFVGRAEPMAKLEAALSRLQWGVGGMVLVGGESGVGKTRLLMELGREAAGRNVLVLAGESLPGQVARPEAEGGRRGALTREGVSGQRAGQGSEFRTEGELTGDRIPGTTPISEFPPLAESARAPRSAADRSPSPAGGSGPLEALRKPLQRLADRCRERGAEETDRLLGRRGKVLAVYEPALAALPGQERYPEPAELPGEAARLRLFSYLAETFEALAEQVEVLLMLDDLQWADELTLSFLEYWLRRQSLQRQQEPSTACREKKAPAVETRLTGAAQTRLSPVLVVGAYRSEELAVQGLLVPLLGTAELERIDLGRLAAPEVAGIVGDMLALAPAPELFGRYLAKHSEGNPFFVAEYLRAAVGEGLLWRDTEGQWQVAEAGDQQATEATYEALPLPTTLRDLVLRRLQGLERSARRLTRAAAVLGRESDLAELQPMLRLGERALYEALHELMRRQVLELSGPSRLRFVHDKIREAAYANLRKDRRKRLHRAAAESIASLHADELSTHNAALGRHWEEAGEPEKARPCYLAAARAAVQVYGHGEAERLYRAYLRLVAESSADSTEARVELAARILYRRGRSEEAREELLRAADYSRQVGARRDEARSLTNLGDVLLATGQLEEARQTFEKAIAILLELGERQLAAFPLTSLGVLHERQGRTEQAQLALGEALASHRERGDRRSEGIVLGCLGVVHAQQARPATALTLFEQALAVAREIGDRLNEGVCLNNLCSLHLTYGRSEQAWEFGEQALAIYREIGERREEALALLNLGVRLLRRGQNEQAREVFLQSLAVAREVGDVRREAIVLENLGILQDAPERAEQFYEQSLRIYRNLGDRRNQGVLLGYLGVVRLQQGKIEESRQFHQQALELLHQVGDRVSEGIKLVSLARLESMGTGDQDNAARLTEQARALLTELQAWEPLTELFCQQGHIHLASGQSAREPLNRAECLAAKIGAERESGMCQRISRLRLAMAAFEAGEHHRLFRGTLIEDIPEGLRRWLRETGQLPR